MENIENSLFSKNKTKVMSVVEVIFLLSMLVFGILSAVVPSLIILSVALGDRILPMWIIVPSMIFIISAVTAGMSFAYIAMPERITNKATAVAMMLACILLSFGGSVFILSISAM